VVTAVSAAPEHLRAFTQTGPVPAVGRSSSAGPVDTGPPTGMLQAMRPTDVRVARRAARKARHRRRAPLPLRLLTWLSVLLLAAAVTGVWAMRTHARQLASWHILKVTLPDGQPLPPPPPAPVHQQAPPPAAVNLVSTNSAASVYSVASQAFTVGVVTSSPCWVQVTGPNSLTPVFDQTVPAGQTKTFDANGALTVQVGSAGVVVAVSINGTTQLLVKPPAAPFTYTFNSTAGSA